MSSKDNRLYYLRQGRCAACGGKNPVIKGQTLCIECNQKHNDSHNARKRAWRESGLCTRCGAERDSERRMCKRCREYSADLRKMNSENAKKWRAKQRAKGFCTRCGKTWAEPGMSWCRKCQIIHRRETNNDDQRQKTRERRQKRIEAGLCIDCGAPAKTGSKRCERCIEMRRDSSQKYRIKKKLEKQIEEARRQANAHNAG